MIDPLTPETLDDLELDCEDERVITLPSTTVLALVAECRELRRLKGALEFLCHERDALVTVAEGNGDSSCSCTEADSLLGLARSLGWKEGT